VVHSAAFTFGASFRRDTAQSEFLAEIDDALNQIARKRIVRVLGRKVGIFGNRRFDLFDRVRVMHPVPSAPIGFHFGASFSFFSSPGSFFSIGIFLKKCIVVVVVNSQGLALRQQ
jgi:hypothetical protein